MPKAKLNKNNKEKTTSKCNHDKNLFQSILSFLVYKTKFDYIFAIHFEGKNYWKSWAKLIKNVVKVIKTQISSAAALNLIKSSLKISIEHNIWYYTVWKFTSVCSTVYDWNQSCLNSSFATKEHFLIKLMAWNQSSMKVAKRYPYILFLLSLIWRIFYITLLSKTQFPFLYTEEVASLTFSIFFLNYL